MYDNSEYEKKLVITFLPPILVLAAGIYIIILNLPTSIKWNDLKNNGIQAEATILSIRKVSNQHGRTSTTVHCAYVKYMYEGKEYKGNLNTYSPEMREGGTVLIMVSRDDPHIFMAEPRKNGELYVIGAVLILAGGFMMFMGYKKLKSE